MPPLLLPPLFVFLLVSQGIDEERTTIRRRPRADTAKYIGAGRAEGREGAGVIVLQNNLNFNYFGELQKRRCDSLTVCHRKINWLLLLPSSSDHVSSVYPFLSFSLIHIYTHMLHFLI